ncbi:MAG: TRAP transporter small permease [Pseudotabrizicola sp.]|uniref:TRAP transporter small permease subunit n=1 Tax=Pseudotabrizicola sp. TaxID=2939647 RepID=UPI002721808F|nr:TRAP transporter small permease [Pseudotabrizicola sp.]MDO8883691.1 TRAP transporter small permease [Pseudotabrizicola sp.]MDP2079631.1 TRAP transporter small permease [Pseudotabrizicola sp.]MDZ7574606.1 TRAP transporter small permease [Pseudotabrizicola sp.]
MERYSRMLGIIFGMLMLLLSVAITAETLLRKLFSVTLGGIDELGGYAIAVAAPLAFTVALIGRGHIRINQVSRLFPRRVQAVLDVVAVVSFAALSLFFLHFAIQTVIDTYTYKSIAQTQWATPLIWPQTVWLIATATFPTAAVIFAFRAVVLLARGDWQGIARSYGTVGAAEELQEELDDLRRREVEAGLPAREKEVLS